MDKPPLGVEEALDLVLALPAHRSDNARHSDFGKMLVDEYFVKLRARYSSDETASHYLDDVFACIASAVRAFSVQRDIFATQWQARRQQRQYALDRANRLDAYSPLKEKGVWGKVLALVGGAGVGAGLTRVLQSKYGVSWILMLAAICLGLVFSVIVLDWLLNVYRGRLLAKVERDFPSSLEESWRQQTLVQYRTILRQFLLSAIKARECWYPDLLTLRGKKVFGIYDVPHIEFSSVPTATSEEALPVANLWPVLDEIIDRHMAFK